MNDGGTNELVLLNADSEPIASTTVSVATPDYSHSLVIEKIFIDIRDALGTDRLKNFHSHFSKIEYTTGGEKKHLTFEDNVYGPDFEPLMELIYKYDCSPVFICESAGTQAEDAKQMKDYYLKLISG